jgi:hypothetical protein
LLAGKTTTFELLTGASVDTPGPEPGDPGTLWVTGSELSDSAAFESVLGEHLSVLPRTGDVETLSGTLTIVLDQLDESADLTALPQRFARKLKGKDPRSLRVFVACRTADYPERLTTVLRQSCGDCVVADLAPLTRADVMVLVSSVGMDPSAFVDAAVASGVGALASVPLTLKVLLSAFRQDERSLDRGPRALFELGVSSLVTEHAANRAANASSTSSAPQRLVIASRIATRLVLSAQRTIWIGQEVLVDGGLTAGMLSGGAETTVRGTFVVTNVDVGETLKTALFSRSGPNRAAFAHSSFAAFLAARYLVARFQGTGAAVSKQQLSGVFLVAAYDEDTASIPVHLRETAAWLLAHAPHEYRWLAAADPEGLMAHSAYITDNDIRALMVAELLRRADEIELSERSWQRTRWHLAHPGLAGQLEEVLDRTLSTPSSEWSDFAQARLAVHLARDCAVSALCDPLLRLAEADGWPIALRQAAAKAAMETSSEEAAPRLRRLLASLKADNDNASVTTDDVATRDSTERDELVGTLLSLLWPDHLELADALPHVHPVGDPIVFGGYRWQLRQLPLRVHEADLATLVRFARDLLAEMLGVPAGRPLIGHHAVMVASTRVAVNRRSVEATIREFITPVVERVIASPSVLDHLPEVVEVLAGLLYASVRLTLPATLDLVDEQGREQEPTRNLRRRVAEELIRQLLDQTGEFNRHHAHMVTSRWTQDRTWAAVDRGVTGPQRGGRVSLLDDHDVRWALERADHHRAAGRTLLGNALMNVASVIADLSNRDTLELVFAREGTSDWDYFPWLHGSTSPEDALAKAADRTVPADEQWDHSNRFIEVQRQRLQDAATGDTQAFWQLVVDLQRDPATGQPQQVASYDIMSYPGTTLWSEETFRSDFRAAARHFVDSENDHRDEWLGTNQYDYRAEAGYTALAFLHDSGDLDGFADRWRAWVAAVLVNAHLGDTPTAADVAQAFVARVAQHAPTELADTIHRLVRASLARGQAPWYLPSLVPLVPQALHQVLTDLAAEVHVALTEHVVTADADSDAGTASNDPESPADLDQPVAIPPTTSAKTAAIAVWADLILQPLMEGNEEAARHAGQILHAGDVDPDLAVAAGRALLRADAADAWPRIQAVVETSSEFSRKLAASCANTEHLTARTNTVTIAEALSDSELIAAFRWLATICPPGTEVHKAGWHAVTDEHRIHDWRNSMLSTLSQRATKQAILGIRALVQSFPDALEIQAALINARRRAQARDAVMLTPDQVLELLADPDRRIIRTAMQLAALLADTITHIQEDLDTHANLLWDCERQPVPADAPAGTRRGLTWRPKPEGTLVAYLAHELDLRLQRRGIVINREVMVKPTDAGDSGERPDILVDATDSTSHEIDIVTVPVEVKGAWHSAVLTAQRDQLAGQYLNATGSDAGIYLVGWFPLDLWDADDKGRQSTAKKHKSADALLSVLEQQAADIFDETGKRTVPCVLTIARAAPTADRDAEPD